MKYMGSKNRIAKYILPIMLAEREPDQWWVEPFVGGGNIIDKVDGKRLGADSNKHAIEALITIRDFSDDLPKDGMEFGEEDYRALRLNSSFPYKGFAGFAYSYGGKWMGGWGRDGVGVRDYVKEAYTNAVKQSPNIQGVHFTCSNYFELRIPPGSLVYCDPPYAQTTRYSQQFNHSMFWQWCRVKAKEGHTLFVSEYSAPGDFTCVWEKEIVSSLTKNTGSKRGVERLFRYSG